MLPVLQEFQHLKDLMVPNEPESLFLTTSGHCSVPRSIGSPTALVFVRPTSSPISTIHEEGLSPPVQYMEEYYDSDLELSIQDSPIYSRRHFPPNTNARKAEYQTSAYYHVG